MCCSHVEPEMKIVRFWRGFGTQSGVYGVLPFIKLNKSTNNKAHARISKTKERANKSPLKRF